MMQFIRFIDAKTGGVILLLANELVGLRPAPDNIDDVTIILTKHGSFHVNGNADFILDIFSRCFGEPWDAVPSDDTDDDTGGH